MPLPRLIRGLILGLLVIAAPCVAQESAANPLKSGALPNGLRYSVLTHPSPRGDVSLRLVVHVGSLDERDDERGFAHFVEHMAFNGTRRFPAGTLKNYFQKLGLTFGADLNASTSYTHTIYQLDLPDGVGGKVDEALEVLRDYADGVLFGADEVKREAGVVISELRARDTAGRRAGLEQVEALYGGTRIAERDIVGEAAQLEVATPEQLRAFYQRHYQPGRMTVVVVGPFDANAIVGKLTAAFGSIAVPAEVVAPAPVPEPPRFAGAKAAVTKIPSNNASVVEFVHLRPRAADTPEGHREELVQRVATAILNQRMGERREANVSKYGTMRAGYTAGPVGLLIHHSIGAQTSAADWPDALELVEAELRRARTFGLSQTEVDEAVEGQLTSVRNQAATHVSQPAARISADLARFATLGRNWQPPEAGLAETTRALEGLTAAEATAAIAEILPSESLNIVLGVPLENGTRPERVLAAYNRSTTRTLRRASEEDERLVFRYENLGPPGKIERREHVPDLDITLAALANGVRVNVRPNKSEPDRFRLRVVFPLNLSNVPDDTGGIADLAGMLLLRSNLKQHKQTELSRLIRLHGIAPQFSVSQGTPLLNISGPASELTFALQFLTAVLSELQLDLDHYRVALNGYGGLYQTITVNAGPLALHEALRVYLGNDRRAVLQHPRDLAIYGPEVAEKWLVDHILQAPLEIGIVGDFTADSALGTAAATVGTLRRRRPPPKAGRPLAAPTRAARMEGTAEISASTSMSCILWPITVPDTPRDNAALALANDVMRDRLMMVLRESLGLTYSPTTRMYRDLIQRDFAFAGVINTFDPARARQFTEGCVRLAAQFAAQGVTPAEFARLREPIRTRHAEELRSNAWWLNSVVSLAQLRPEVLEQARVHGTIMDQVTAEDVNAAAKTFTPERVTVMILRPAAPGAGAAGEQKAGPGRGAPAPRKR